MTEAEEQKKKAQRLLELEALKTITFDELKETFEKWFIMSDPYILKFLLAFFVASKLPRKAVWAMIVAPSGGGKTEFLSSITDLEKVYEVSLLTPQTFLSGTRSDKDPSLLPKITGGILMMKDWTSILSMQKDARAEIMSQFREIWDGKMTKAFGNGMTRSWEGKLSVLAGCTEAVDLSQQMYTHLGERFVFYRLILPDRKEVGARAMQNESVQEQMALELKNAMYAFMKGIDLQKAEKPEPPPAVVQKKLIDLAYFCTIARSGVIRDYGGRKEVLFVPTAEMPTRILQQLSSIAAGCMIVNGGKMTDEDIQMLYKVALDSIPKQNKLVIVEMAKGDEQTTAEIAMAIGYPTEPIGIYLENLALLGICQRTKMGDNANRWTMKKEFVDIIRLYEKISALTDQEMHDRKIDTITHNSGISREDAESNQEAIDNF